MSYYKVETNNKDYNEFAFGAQFKDGVGFITDPWVAEHLKNKGYKVTKTTKAKAAEAVEDEVEEEAPLTTDELVDVDPNRPEPTEGEVAGEEALAYEDIPEVQEERAQEKIDAKVEKAKETGAVAAEPKKTTRKK